MSPFEFYQNNMVLKADALYKAELYGANEKLISYYSYESKKKARKFKVVKNACPGNPPLLAFDTMDIDLKQKVVEVYGDPYKILSRNRLAEILTNDAEAFEFYSTYIRDDGKALSEKQITQYTAEASILNAIKGLFKTRIARLSSAAGAKKAGIWQKLSSYIQDLSTEQYPHRLPVNDRSLERKYNKFIKQGYEALIHGGTGNLNSEKINNDAKEWLIARWGDRVNKVANVAQMLDEYNERAKDLAWKPLKSDSTIRDYLYRPDVQYLWYGHRYGELKFKEKFVFHSSTKMPTMRDSLWYSDGTKLNFFYKDENGKVATLQVYEVIDAYSDVLLGYHISKSEDYEAQFNAYKMAINFAGHKPYELKYDNQGGHKKLENSSFLKKIAHLALKTKPYNGKSKTIEPLFNRLQSRFMKVEWFFTGQNITAKKGESKINREFLLANTQNLPTLDDMKEIYVKKRDEWNNAPHHKTGIKRIDMYNQSTNPGTPEFGILEYIDVFWVLREKPITCRAGGLSFTHKGVEYKYVLYKQNGKVGYDRDIDVPWIARNIKKKFYVRFDPSDFSVIRLYEKDAKGDLRFVTEAETLIVPHRNKQEQESWEAKHFAAVNKAQDDFRITVRDTMDSMQSFFDISVDDYGMNKPPLKGIETGKRHKNKLKKVAEAEKEATRKRKDEWLSGQQDSDKYTSNYVPVEDSDLDEFDSVEQRLANKI
jgi:hypothetical protein